MTQLVEKEASLEDIRSLLEGRSIAAEIREPGHWLAVQVRKIPASLRLGRHTLHYQSFWQLDPAAERMRLLEVANRINVSLPMVRAVADIENGSLAFGYALRLYGGLAPGTIVATLRRFAEVVGRAMAEIAVQAGVVLTQGGRAHDATSRRRSVP